MELILLLQSQEYLWGLSETTFSTLLGAIIGAVFATLGSAIITYLVQRAERKKWEEQREWEKEIWIFEIRLQTIEKELLLYENIGENMGNIVDYCVKEEEDSKYFFSYISKLPCVLFLEILKIKGLPKDKKEKALRELGGIISNEHSELKIKKEMMINHIVLLDRRNDLERKSHSE